MYAGVLYKGIAESSHVTLIALTLGHAGTLGGPNDSGVKLVLLRYYRIMYKIFPSKWISCLQNKAAISLSIRGLPTQRKTE